MKNSAANLKRKESKSRAVLPNIMVRLLAGWFQATVAFMIMGLIVAVVAGVTGMYMPVSATLEFVAGQCTRSCTLSVNSVKTRTYKTQFMRTLINRF